MSPPSPLGERHYPRLADKGRGAGFSLACPRAAPKDPSVLLLTPKYLEQHPDSQTQGPAPVSGRCWHLFKAGVALLPGPTAAHRSCPVCSALGPGLPSVCWVGHGGLPFILRTGTSLGRGSCPPHTQSQALESKGDPAWCTQPLCSLVTGASMAPLSQYSL